MSMARDGRRAELLRHDGSTPLPCRRRSAVARLDDILQRDDARRVQVQPRAESHAGIQFDRMSSGAGSTSSQLGFKRDVAAGAQRLVENFFQACAQSSSRTVRIQRLRDGIEREEPQTFFDLPADLCAAFARRCRS